MAKSVVFSGVIWASIQRFGNLAISFISNMVMARLLTPDDFGTIGMLMFFLALAQTFVDSGFGAALIQKKEITEEDTSTVFFINMGMSLLLYILLYVGAPYIADFYGIEVLTPLLRVMGFTVLIQGITLIQTIQLQKKMNFKTLSICNLSGSFVLAVTGITAAILGCGVWSLVIRSLAGAATTSIMLWCVSKWRPSWIFSINSFKQLFSFGGFMLLSSLFMAVSKNIHTMIVGKLFRPSTLGNFTQARTLRNIPTESCSAVIAQVLYPDFSNHQDDNGLIKEKLEKSAYIISYIVTSMMFLCILIGDPLIHLFYGGQWDEAVPYFQILCLGGIPLCLQDININVIKAKGKSGVLFTCNLVKVVIYCILMVIGGKLWGIYGFLWVMVFYSFFAYFVYAIVGTHYIRTTIVRQLLNMMKCCILAGIPLFLIMQLKTLMPSLHIITQIIVYSFLYVTVLVLASLICRSFPFNYLKSNFKLKK